MRTIVDAELGGELSRNQKLAGINLQRWCRLNLERLYVSENTFPKLSKVASHNQAWIVLEEHQEPRTDT